MAEFLENSITIIIDKIESERPHIREACLRNGILPTEADVIADMSVKAASDAIGALIRTGRTAKTVTNNPSHTVAVLAMASAMVAHHASVFGNSCEGSLVFAAGLRSKASAKQEGN